MTTRDPEFYRRLLETFAEEAAEHLGRIAPALTALERSDAGGYAGLAEAIFREIHTLKGAARAVEATEVESLCHELEAIFSTLRRGGVRLPAAQFDLLYQALDRLSALLTDRSAPARNQARALAKRLAQLGRHLPGLPAAEPIEPAQPAASDEPDEPPQNLAAAQVPTPLGDERLRVDPRRLNAIFLQSEGLLSVDLALREQVTDAAALCDGLAEQQRILGNLRSDLRQLEQLLGGAGTTGAAARRSAHLLRHLRQAVQSSEEMSKAFHTRSHRLATSLTHNRRSFTLMRGELTHGVQDISLMPLISVLQPLTRLVRDLAREQDKPVELVTEGTELELDPRVLEALRDIFVHLIRNAVDHGIEPAAERTARGKPATATVRIAAAPRDTGLVEVTVADDGRGIDPDQVAAAAVRAGRVKPEAVAGFSPAQLIGFVLGSGVSTRTEVTRLSGRGVGLAIVDEKIASLGGKLEIDNEPGAGCRFRIVLPISVASLRGVLVSAAGQSFVLPTPRVERVLRIDPDSLRVLEGRQTVHVDGAATACAVLGDLLGLAAGTGTPGTAVLLRADGQPLALLVDTVEAEQEVLAKSLGKQLRRVPGVSGATVLGDGRLVPILNVADLLSRAARDGAGALARAPQEAAPAKRVLVAEDSVTSRLLLKNLIEAAGYEVEAVADGLEAYGRLLAEPFDIVISDVEMPRLNGFGLTEKIRATPTLAELPVVLVTALGSAADQQRGLQAGANAYIVKSSFDQDDLLQLINRMA